MGHDLSVELIRVTQALAGIDTREVAAGVRHGPGGNGP
jgi:hypothetical protein